jgi:hypothetical protein
MPRHALLRAAAAGCGCVLGMFAGVRFGRTATKIPFVYQSACGREISPKMAKPGALAAKPHQCLQWTTRCPGYGLCV